MDYGTDGVKSRLSVATDHELVVDSCVRKVVTGNYVLPQTKIDVMVLTTAAVTVGYEAF